MVLSALSGAAIFYLLNNTLSGYSSSILASGAAGLIGSFFGGIYIVSLIGQRLRYLYLLAIAVSVATLTLMIYPLATTVTENINFSFLIALALALCITYGWIHVYLFDRNRDNKGKNFSSYILLSSGLLVMILVGLHAVQYQLNPDGISYFAIAEHYSNFNIRHAVNAYWSPMLSWLLVPFIWIGLSVSQAFRVVLFIAMIAILAVQYILQNRFIDDRRSNARILKVSGLTVSTLGLFVFSALGPITPDAVVLLWVVVYAFLLIELFSCITISNSLVFLLGVMGALGFYTKGFLLPLYVLTLIVALSIVALKYRENLRHYITSGVMMIALTIVIISPWVFALSMKYDKFTLGSSSSYNMSFVGPNSIKHPINSGLISPSHALAYNAWEDPTNHEYIKWSPLQSFSDAAYHLLNNIPRNYKAVIASVAHWSPLIFISVLAGPFIYLISRNREKLWHDNRYKTIAVVSIVSIVYLIGYIMVHLVGGDRYIYPIFILGVVGLLALVSYYFDKSDNKQKIALSVTALLSLLLFVYTYILPISISKSEAYKQDKTLTTWASDLQAHIPESSRIAASGSKGYEISYLMNLKSFGKIPDGSSYDDKFIQDALSVYGIQYFFCHNDIDTNCGFGKSDPIWRQSTPSDFSLSVYKLDY